MYTTRFLNIGPILRHGKVYATQYNGMKICNSGVLHLLKQNGENKQKIRFVSTYEVKSDQKEDSLIRKVLNKIPFLSIDRTKIRLSAYLLYAGIADTVNYIAFFDEFDLPDTFYSWFVVTELHIWMLSVRAMAEGEDGKFLRNCLVEALWADVAPRVKKLGCVPPKDQRLILKKNRGQRKKFLGQLNRSNREREERRRLEESLFTLVHSFGVLMRLFSEMREKYMQTHSSMTEQVTELSEQLQAALIAYDEGLQSSDIVLAGALWRRLYQSEEVDLDHLQQLVKYIRKHITLLDSTSRDRLFKDHSITWEHPTK